MAYLGVQPGQKENSEDEILREATAVDHPLGEEDLEGDEIEREGWEAGDPSGRITTSQELRQCFQGTCVDPRDSS